MKLFHSRHYPVKHSFSYNVFYFCLALNELQQLSKRLLFFSYNKFNVFSVLDKHFLDPNSDPIKEKVYHHLSNRNISIDVSRVELISTPKYFGYSFNPVSFYICYQGASIVSVLVEVANTYGERHLYILDESNTKNSEGSFSADAKKQFFVSPFNDVSGSYSFSVDLSQDSLNLGIDLYDKNGRRIMTTQMVGTSRTLNDKSLLRATLNFPFSILLTMPRITFQAIALRIKSLKTYLKPRPTSQDTIRRSREPFLRRVHFYLSKFG